MGYTNSSLVTYTRLSPNNSGTRNHDIDTITIHCLVAQWTAKQGCDYFAKASSNASANYVIGKDGSIGLCVEEKNRSWCTSSSSNDNRAVTIEVASDMTHPYAVTNAAYNALIKLCADICRRNGIEKLLWKGDKSLIGQVDKQNMTVHRWFKNKACPGEYLYSRHGEIAEKVNAILNPVKEQENKENNTESKNLYRVGTDWKDGKCVNQKGAFTNKDNAISKAKENNTWKVFDEKGKVIYPEIKKDVKVDVYYRVKTAKDGWLPEVRNLEDFAGNKGAITDVAIRVSKGSIKYRVHSNGKWYGYITKCDIKDNKNGYAGIGKPIDAIEIYYTTPNDIKPCKKAKYRISVTGNDKYYTWQYDNETGNGQDGYAGCFGKSIDRLQLCIE